MKLGRTYQLSVEVGPFDKNNNATQHVDLYPPLTCEFEIKRNYLASAQTGTFTILQLSAETRNLIFKDRYNTLQYAALQFRAGYISQGGFIPLLFNGTLRWAYSERTGQTDVRTTMEGFDGGFAMANGFSSRTFAAGTDLQTVIRSLNGDLPNIYQTPIVGNFGQKSGRGITICGPTFKAIQDNLPRGSTATIDNNQLKVLNDNEFVQIGDPNDIPTISARTGLLDVPVRSGAMITCKVLFEPRLTIGSAVYLSSASNTIYNGLKKVMGFTHRGIISGGLNAEYKSISGSVNGECVTEVQLWDGTAPLQPIVGTTPL